MMKKIVLIALISFCMFFGSVVMACAPEEMQVESCTNTTEYPDWIQNCQLVESNN